MYLLSSVTLCTKYYIRRQRNKDYVSNALSRDCRNDASSSTDSWIFNSTFCQNSDSFYYLKLRHYEMATKFEKNLTAVLTKQLFLLSSVKTSGMFLQIFVSLSEKLNFKIRNSAYSVVVHIYILWNKWVLIYIFPQIEVKIISLGEVSR